LYTDVTIVVAAYLTSVRAQVKYGADIKKSDTYLYTTD